MLLAPMPAHQVPDNWHWMGELLRPAVERSERTLDDVREALEARRYEAWRLTGDRTDMLLVVSLSYEDRLILWVNYVGGKCGLRPKAWLRLARTVIAELETLARRAGCRELRFGGRDWPLPGYEPYSTEHPSWVRKVLTDG